MENLFLILRTMIFVFVAMMWLKYYLFLIISPFYPIKEHLRYIYAMRSVTKSGQGLYNPRISVIVPAWNEEVGVVKTIDSVLKNTYKNIELIIVNDGSIDTTHQKVMEYIQDEVANKRLDLKNINYIAQPNQGKGQALNNGIKASTGDIIMTIDADSALQPKAITNLVKYYLDPKIMCVVGNVKVAKNNTFVGLVQQLEYYFGFYFKRAYAILGAEYIFGGACASFRREVFDIIGYYDTDNKTEDIELSMRTRWAGLECTYAEDVVCYTEGASDVLSLVNQRVRWKKGRFDTFWRYRKIFLSVSKEHNSWLSFFILPYALLSELQLLFEPISISILITYSIVASDYLSFAIGLIFILQIYLVASFFGDEGIKWKKILLFPFTWIIFYFLVWVEFLSLLKSISMIINGHQVQWQQWKRRGIKEQI